MCTRSDEVVLESATALKTDFQSWISLAKADEDNDTPTKIVLFEQKTSPLVVKGVCKYLGVCDVCLSQT